MGATLSSAIQRWSTRDVDESQRLDYYDEALCSSIDSMRILRSVEKRFEAQIDCIDLGHISLIHGVGPAHDCIRDQHDVARSSGRSFHLILNKGSAWRVRHIGEHLLRKGDIILLDSNYGHRFGLLSPFDNVHIKLSEAWVKQWLPDPASVVGSPIPFDSGWGGALSAFMAQLTPELIADAPLPQHMITDHIGALLALYTSALTGRSPADSPPHRQLRDRIQEVLVQRCTELSLNAAEVAATLGISPRTLHRSLAAQQLTFGTLLMRARVELATRMLESPLFRRLTTAEIGRRAGFTDPSHFARVYRRHCHFTPGQVQAGHSK
jgi:AraC-like DNA-binding protein